jgi:AraC-like DNA-binding protein
MFRPIENARKLTGIEPLARIECWNERNLEIAVWRLPGQLTLKLAAANHFACFSIKPIERHTVFDGYGNHLRTGPVRCGRFRFVQGPSRFETRLLNPTPIEILSIHFSTPLLDLITRDLGLRPRQAVLQDPMWEQADQLAETLARSVVEQISSPLLADRMFAVQSAMLILRRLVARHSSGADPSGAAEPRPQDDLRWVHEYMINKIDEPVAVAQLATLAKKSTFSFTRAFAKIYGKTPAAYLRRLRLERAKEMLVRTSLPIAMIAHRLGYSDAAHFVTAFKRDAGITPRGFRLSQTTKTDR